MSEALDRAREYELLHEREIAPEERPAFHLSPRVGWMNDPNGFSYYKGQYHMFYQYYPYDSHWGPMHWGHAVSTDLLRWEYLPAALAPDTDCDGGGVFSGSAVTLPDGRQMLMYTGVAGTKREIESGRAIQTQCLAFGDGRDYEKYAGNPVIDASCLPEGGSPYDFRDPKMWRAPDGSWRMAAADDFPGEGGRILLFRSDDALRWTYAGVLAENSNRIGRMWECPDFFPLDGTHVLLASAQDMLPRGFEYHNGNGTFYMLGDFDPAAERFTPSCDYAADYGIDFYAPQTVLTPDGRRVMIGWMQNWDTCNLHTRTRPWFGQMSLPRELSVKNGRLCQAPLRELEQLRAGAGVHERLAIENGEISLPGLTGRKADISLEIEPDGELYHKFSLFFAKNSDYHTGLSFRPRESTLKIDRKFSGSRRAIIHQRRALVRHDAGALRLRVILDRFSAEIFVGNGEQVLSATIDTPPEAEGISFRADGRVKLKVDGWTLA
ncbi:MAG: glycoside hydrolase family 32 protein [Oscillospiraceae bacterium]|nr:glycoside hydrolase family 32 protein [Oscillospiraceae bacterium]